MFLLSLRYSCMSAGKMLSKILTESALVYFHHIVIIVCLVVEITISICLRWTLRRSVD